MELQRTTPLPSTPTSVSKKNSLKQQTDGENARATSCLSHMKSTIFVKNTQMTNSSMHTLNSSLNCSGNVSTDVIFC